MSTIPFCQNLELVPCHSVVVELEAFQLPFRGSKWEVEQAIRTLCKQPGPISLEADMSENTTILHFESEGVAKAFASGIHQKVLNVGGERARANAQLLTHTIVPTSEEMEFHTVVLERVPAKWVGLDEKTVKSGEASEKLLEGLRVFGDVLCCEVAAEHVKVGGRDPDEFAFTLPPLHVTVWVQYSNDEGFEAALRGLYSKVLRMKGGEMVKTLKVSADDTGYLSGAARKDRAAKRTADARRIVEQERRFKSNTNALAKLQADLVTVTEEFERHPAPACVERPSAPAALEHANLATQQASEAGPSADNIERLISNARSALGMVQKAVRGDLQEGALIVARENEAALMEADEAVREAAVPRLEVVRDQLRGVSSALDEGKKERTLMSAVAAAVSRTEGLIRMCSRRGMGDKVRESVLADAEKEAKNLAELVDAVVKLRVAKAAAQQTRKTVENDSFFKKAKDPPWEVNKIEEYERWSGDGGSKGMARAAKSALQAAALWEQRDVLLKSLLEGAEKVRQAREMQNSVMEILAHLDAEVCEAPEVAGPLVAAEMRLVTASANPFEHDAEALASFAKEAMERLLEVKTVAPKLAESIAARQKAEAEARALEEAERNRIEENLRNDVKFRITALNRRKNLLQEQVRLKKASARLKAYCADLVAGELFGHRLRKRQRTASIDTPSVVVEKSERWRPKNVRQDFDCEFEKGEFAGKGNEWKLGDRYPDSALTAEESAVCDIPSVIVDVREKPADADSGEESGSEDSSTHEYVDEQNGEDHVEKKRKSTAISREEELRQLALRAIHR